MSTLRLALILALLPVLSIQAELPRAFLKQYCFKCHGPDKQKAKRRYDQLPSTISTLDELELWQEILDQLNLAEMPPEDEMQPAKPQLLEAIRSITQSIAAARPRFAQQARHTPLRRMNSWEYRQTIGDLLGLNVEAWNPAENFPPEVKVNGFDNNGAGLITSGLLLDHYLSTAAQAIERATQFGARPALKKYAQQTPFYFNGNESKDLPKLFKVDRFRFIPETPYTDLYGRHYRGGHIGFLPLHRQGGVAHSGVYIIRVRAAAVGRVHDYGKALGDFRNGDPLVMEIASVDRRGSVTSTGNVSKMTSLARIELTNEDPKWFEWKVYMEAGYEPEVRFRNGPLAAKRMVRVLTTQAADKPEFKPFVDMKPGYEKAHGVLKAYRGPKLRVWEIQISGPFVKEWPLSGHQLMYGSLNPEELNRDNMRERLRIFAAKAFRRPLRPGELSPIESMVYRKLGEGMKPLKALQLGFQTILCSPAFLFLEEGEGKLSEHALAARLSYFLWSSTPDAELLKLAGKNKLKTSATLREQVNRMLQDQRSNRFVQNFTRVWLNLDNIGETPPSKDFTVYYRDNLEEAMRNETQDFFKHVLEHNLPPSEFLEANYSFLNRELALHYGIEGIKGNHMRQVSIKGTPRGGLLGQGAFLTASANGVDTSPVVRGIYVMEKLLGYSPPQPPPDVPEIEPDIRGAKTIREQLAKHREIATCAECHRKIDPLGFALENFDAIGRWRDQYGKGMPVNPAGKLPSGEAFASAGEFKNLMAQKHDQFTRCLTQKLLTYATGREQVPTDRPVIDSILREMKKDNQGLRDLIHLIVLSEVFSQN
jgi:cytochrome c553